MYWLPGILVHPQSLQPLYFEGSDRCFSLAKEKHLSDPSKYRGWSDWGCTRIPGNQYNAKFVYVGGAIISYLHNHEEDFGIINPFDPTNKVPVNQNGSCPNVDNVGRINAHLDENKNKILLCVRYGVGANDIIQETMENPYWIIKRLLDWSTKVLALW